MNEKEKEKEEAKCRELEKKILTLITIENPDPHILITSLCNIFQIVLISSGLPIDHIKHTFSLMSDKIENAQKQPFYQAASQIKTKEDLEAFSAVMSVLRSGKDKK